MVSRDFRGLFMLYRERLSFMCISSNSIPREVKKTLSANGFKKAYTKHRKLNNNV